MQLQRSRLNHFVLKYQKMHIWIRASSLAFHSLLAIVPILGFIFLYLNKVGLTGRWLDELKRYLIDNVNVLSEESFSLYFGKLIAFTDSSSWDFLGLFLLAYASWSLITRFGKSLDAILRVKLVDQPTLTLGYFRLIIRRTLILLLLPILLVAFLWLGSWFIHEVFERFIDGKRFSVPVTLLVTWASSVVVFSFVYYFTPRRPVYYWSCLRASVFVVIALETSKYLISAYSHYAITAHKVFGVFIVIPLTLLWVQFFWAIVLSGGLLLRALPGHCR